MTPSTDSLNARERLLEAAESLVLERGYGATSVDDICSKAKVKRGSFFYYFKNKEELGKELIDQFASKMNEALRCSSAGRSADPLKRIYAYIDSAIKLSQNPDAKGCLVGTMTQEIHLTHPKLRQCCSEKLESTVALFKQDLAEAKKTHAPKAGFDVKSLAETFVALTQGSIILAKAHQDPLVMERSLKHFKRYLKTLFE